MNNKRKTICVISTAIAVVFSIAVFHAILKKYMLLKRIEDLGSRDIEACKSAQTYLIHRGKGIVPLLSEHFSSSRNNQQKFVLIYVIGEIDPDAYFSILRNLPSKNVRYANVFEGISDHALGNMAKEKLLILKEIYSNLMNKNQIKDSDKAVVEKFIKEVDAFLALREEKVDVMPMN